ncbi:dihydrofolate reductase family protein [Nonomuraea sp. NPDC050556]|uniref:dihydrofolate reductase family protein n=1 Tax=Nonomuraea sp. NPDC050556 TaxID=3364369 RepID=UPI003792EA95
MTETREIVAGLFISLDGVVEAPETWHFPYLNDELEAAVADMYAEADTLLLGRATYESFAAVWPDLEDELADQLNGMSKLVASTTLEKAGWNNSTVVDGDLTTALKQLKQQPGGKIVISGSISVVRELLQAGLIDELRLLVHPIVLGSGQRLFAEGVGQVPLALTRSVTFTTGVLDLSYQPA